MKINKINSFTQKKTRENSRANQDLTSFGASENKATAPVHSTKAAAAIKSKFLSGVSFKGYTETIVHGKLVQPELSLLFPTLKMRIPQI